MLSSGRRTAAKPSPWPRLAPRQPAISAAAVLAFGMPRPLRPCTASSRSCRPERTPLPRRATGPDSWSSRRPFSFTMMRILAPAGSSGGPPKTRRLAASSKAAASPSKLAADLVVSASARWPPPHSTSTVRTMAFLLDSTPRWESPSARRHRTSRTPWRRRRKMGWSAWAPIGKSQGVELRERANVTSSARLNTGLSSDIPCSVERAACGEPRNGAPAATQERTCVPSQLWPQVSRAYSRKYWTTLFPIEWATSTTPRPERFSSSTWRLSFSKKRSLSWSAPGAKRQS
mmetsp:Transcript_41014/g.116150  ORF Transcript_41014/g.116150 Transcript_41014/m.116150 type:complete len:288 (-) Transcript_41014:217-1080(-)